VIDKLAVRNFKVIREADLLLRPLTVIVGPNGSGKSTLLGVISKICAMLKGNSGVFQADECRSRHASGPTSVEYAGSFFGQEHSEKMLIHLGMSEEEFFETISGQSDGQIHWNFRKGLPLVSVTLCLRVDKLAAPSYPKETSLALPADGEGLSSVLSGFLLEHPKRFMKILEQLRAIVPGIEDLRFRRSQVGNGIGDELLFDMKGATGIPASAVSDGTLLTLGLLTVLAAPEPPQIVLIDELERSLHPRALGDLVTQLRFLQEQNPRLQIIATSHSPYLVDHLEPEEVLLTSLDEEGYATVRPLTDHPDFEKWKDVMAPGEFWSTVGEKWVTEKVGA
jgi:predicted ATPase